MRIDSSISTVVPRPPIMLSLVELSMSSAIMSLNMCVVDGGFAAEERAPCGRDVLLIFSSRKICVVNELGMSQGYCHEEIGKHQEASE